jgi:hypothetical protein
MLAVGRRQQRTAGTRHEETTITPDDVVQIVRTGRHALPACPVARACDQATAADDQDQTVGTTGHAVQFVAREPVDRAEVLAVQRMDMLSEYREHVAIPRDHALEPVSRVRSGGVRGSNWTPAGEKSSVGTP